MLPGPLPNSGFPTFPSGTPTPGGRAPRFTDEEIEALPTPTGGLGSLRWNLGLSCCVALPLDDDCRACEGSDQVVPRIRSIKAATGAVDEKESEEEDFRAASLHGSVLTFLSWRIVCSGGLSSVLQGT